MSITDRQRLKDVEQSQLSSNEGQMTSTARAVVNAAATRSAHARVTDGGTAATGVAESAFAKVPNAALVKSVAVELPIAVANDATDIVTFTVAKRTAGGAAVTVATGSTLTGALGAITAWTAYPLTLSATAANVQLAAGDVLTVVVAKGGSGKAIAAATSFGVVTIDFEEN